MKQITTSLFSGAAVALVLFVAASGAQAAPRPDLRVAAVGPATAAAAMADGIRAAGADRQQGPRAGRSHQDRAGPLARHAPQS